MKSEIVIGIGVVLTLTVLSCVAAYGIGWVAGYWEGFTDGRDAAAELMKRQTGTNEVWIGVGGCGGGVGNE